MSPVPVPRPEVTRTHRGGKRAFTLVELVIVVAMVVTLAALAVPKYSSALGQARERVAIDDLERIEEALERYRVEHSSLPVYLSQLRLTPEQTTDPWGKPYVYVLFQVTHGVAEPRTDKFLVALNSTYDLYSRGADGKSELPLTAPVSRDDVVRANDGEFLGLAENY
jgi:general secretion pathway protein G